MHLASPQSAILSAVIFNALIIVAADPPSASRGAVPTAGCSGVVARSLLIYGVGGVIAPFVGIKLVDVVLALVGLIEDCGPWPGKS